MSRAGAARTSRSRLKERGLSRFEVLGRDGDRELIRSPARMLAEDGPEPQRLRAALARAVCGAPPRTGGVVAALRRSLAPTSTWVASERKGATSMFDAPATWQDGCSLGRAEPA